MYIRTIWTGANAFEFTFSIDGVTWFKGPVGALTPTLTPTHFAVWLSTTSFESTDQLTASFDYLRVYDADLSI